MGCSLKAYKPVKSADLIRVGNKYDGGYVLNEGALHQSRYLLSFGVNDDWSFEADCVHREPHLKVMCFDHSVSKSTFRENVVADLNEILSARFLLGALTLNFRGVRNKISQLRRSLEVYRNFSRFFSRENIQFFPNGVSNEQAGSFITINDIFHMIPLIEPSENSVFVKMDIEQFEFRVLPELVKFEKYLNGMVVEFHDLDILWFRFEQLMDQIRVAFDITHIHGNNFSGLIPHSVTPKLLEITFLKRNLVKAKPDGGPSRIYPIPGLDSPNNPLEKDHVLEF